jgi:GTPase SAR1 family protein
MLNTTDALSEDFFINEESYIRDRIVILGRRSSGKTVYLSVLYSKLWDSTGPIRIKALKGASHIEFLKNVNDIKENTWPPATQGLSENILELTYTGRKRMIVALDYPGEVFTNAFVKDIESNETKVLLDHIDHAQALILLIDPEHIIKGDLHSKIDNNYGLLQAVNRIQNWPDGKDVPIVLVLTKADKNYPLIKKEGGTKQFIIKYFSQLVRDIHGIKGCNISAYACIHADKFQNSHIAEIDMPLIYCLEKMQQLESKKIETRKKERFNKYITELDKQDKKRVFQNNIII